MSSNQQENGFLSAVHQGFQVIDIVEVMGSWRSNLSLAMFCRKSVGSFVLLCWFAHCFRGLVAFTHPPVNHYSFHSLQVPHDGLRMRPAPELNDGPSFSSLLCSFSLLFALSATLPTYAAEPALLVEPEAQGLSLVTQSELGKSIRTTIVGGAQLADKLDLKWERISDSLRDEAKCDPRTNRRMFDNGFRRDGTRIGNPVLGALCTPEPLKDLDTATATLVLNLGKEAALATLKVDGSALLKKQEEVERLIAPAYARVGSLDNEQGAKRESFNRDFYTQMRAYGDFVHSRDVSRDFERAWGDKLLLKLAPDANRNDYTSPFPKPDDTDDQPYDEGGLLDALGAVSVALGKLQAGGIIGHWEISIPEDDDWNVVTIAIDDDISIGGQILARERKQPLSGSEVIALLRSAMENQARISYKMDTFFIDPTTTRQELYNPTQLLISLSDLGQ